MTVISKTLKTVGQITTGKTPPHIIAVRTATCYSCPTKVNTPKVGLTCGTYLSPVPGVSCGCVVDDKIPVAGAECPQKKWLAVSSK